MLDTVDAFVRAVGTPHARDGEAWRIVALTDTRRRDGCPAPPGQVTTLVETTVPASA